MADINDVIIQGVIVHKFVTPKVAILTISTGSATPTTNYPKVTFFEDVRTEVEEKFKEGDHVCIHGNIQSSKPKPDVKNQTMVAVFGESIEFTHSNMEEAFGVDVATSYKSFKNELKISGVVTRIECPTSNMVRLRVFTRKNGRPSFVPLVHFTRKPEEVLAKIHPQDRICAIGSVQTEKKTIRDEIRYFENYVVNEIVKEED